MNRLCRWTPGVVITLDGQSHLILSLETTGQCAGPAAGTPLQHHASFPLSSAVRLSANNNKKKLPTIWRRGLGNTFIPWKASMTFTRLKSRQKPPLESSFWAHIASPIHIWTGVTAQLCIPNTPNEEECVLLFDKMCSCLLRIICNALNLWHSKKQNTLTQLPTCKQTLIKDNTTQCPILGWVKCENLHVSSLQSATNAYVFTMNGHASWILTCWLHVAKQSAPANGHESSSVRVFCLTFGLSSAVSLSAHRPADQTHHAERLSRMSRRPSAARLLSPASPPRCLCSPIGNWHILLPLQQQQHMLRQTHALLASLVNHFFTAARRADLQTAGGLTGGPESMSGPEGWHTGLLWTQCRIHDSQEHLLSI